jgi:hypothetical protein
MVPVMTIDKFERFFRVAAGRDADCSSAARRPRGRMAATSSNRPICGSPRGFHIFDLLL